MQWGQTRRLHPLVPRGSYSNILGVFFAKVIRELGKWGRSVPSVLFGDFIVFGIEMLNARCPGTQVVLSPCCHPHVGPSAAWDAAFLEDGAFETTSISLGLD